MVALFLASLPKLCKCKVVASTHSDLLAIMLSQLSVLKPNKKQIESLLKELLPYISEGVEDLAEVVAEASQSLDLRIYEFTREGLVSPVKPEDVLSKSVPGITEVIDKLADWAFKVACEKTQQS